MSDEFSASGEPGSLLRNMIRDGIVPPVPDAATEQLERAVSDFLFTGQITLPPVTLRPGLKKGDRVQMDRGGQETHWLVTDIDEDGNGTLELAPDQPEG